jgi:hypothetical protein
LGFTAALGANCRVHLTLATLVSSTKVAALFTGRTASRATAGLVLEAFFSVEFLFTGGEFEIDAAISTFQDFVFKHGFSSSVSCSADSGQRGFSTSPAGMTRRGERARVAGTEVGQARIKNIVMRKFYYNRISGKRQSIF